MNKEQLLEKLNVEKVAANDVLNKIEEMNEIIENGNKFVSRLSLNRYLTNRLSDFDESKRFNLFSELYEDGFVYDTNALFFGMVSYEDLENIIKGKYGLKDIYQFDNFFVESLLDGKDITEDEILLHGVEEPISLEELLQQFVFGGNGMSMGDTPNLMLMLTVKKALLGTYIAQINLEKLSNGDNEMYDLSVLF